ncbi:MAG: tetratricopeptide repeat protein [Bacteroidetes bacterium]|nr:tetratricopeptide repeat protein [Bacteroidota bacterium]
MIKVYIYIFVLISTVISAQSVFTRVRDQNATKIDLVVLDSCNKAGFCKDSVLFYQALIAVRMNKPTEARAAAKQLQRVYPNFREAHFVNGLIYLTEKNYAKSVNQFNILIDKNPKHVKALYNRALAFGFMEEYDKAIDDLTACINLRPMYSLAYYSRGYWSEYVGNYTAAIKDYETTINLDPKNYDAYLGLAYIYRGLKSTSKSCEIINDAIRAGSQMAVEVKDNFCR